MRLLTVPITTQKKKKTTRSSPFVLEYKLLRLEINMFSIWGHAESVAHQQQPTKKGQTSADVLVGKARWNNNGISSEEYYEERKIYKRTDKVTFRPRVEHAVACVWIVSDFNSKTSSA